MKKIVALFKDEDAAEVDRWMEVLSKVAFVRRFDGAESAEPVEPAPLQTEEEKPRRRKHFDKNMTTEFAVMTHFTPQGTFQAKQAKSWMKVQGYSPTSHSSALSYLKQNGYVAFLGGGVYQFVKPFAVGQIKS